MPTLAMSPAAVRVTNRRHDALESHAFDCAAKYRQHVAEALHDGVLPSSALSSADDRHRTYVQWIFDNVGLD